jgi:hypothetical protein
MAEARRLKGGRWRLYVSPELRPVRDPQTGTIVTFDSIEAARRWWRHLGLAEPPPQESVKCARCRAYIGRSASTLYAGRYYHDSHTPQAIEFRR